MTTVLYDDINGRADVIVSGEWLLPDPGSPVQQEYRVGYAATLFRDGWWSGGCTPLMTREVVDRLVADQNAMADRYPSSDIGRLVWEDDLLIYQYGKDPAEYVSSEATPDGYPVGFGWTWTPVDYSECTEVVGDAPRVVTVQFTYPQSLLDAHGEDDLVASVQARMEEFYVGPDNDEFVTGHVAVTVEP